MHESYDVVVIGGGQAGLSMGYYLERKSKSYLILDAGKRIGDSWRDRYDSLELFTPRSFNSLPGFAFPGRKDDCPNKDEVADYLELYVKHFHLNVRLQTSVLKLEKNDEMFQITTNTGSMKAKQVVIATGPFFKPFIPIHSRSFIFELHSSQYKNDSDIPDGSVLVVGGGNTGVQIALELSQTRKVYLSVSEKPRYLPLRFFGKNIFWWFQKLGILNVTIDSNMGKWLSQQKDPIFGLGPMLKAQINSGKITVKTRFKEIEGQSVIFKDGSQVQVENIVWCTGFRSDYSWISIEGIIENQGKPVHVRGKSPVPGLYFLGLPWQVKRGSALLGGVGEDAEYLSELIIQRGNDYASASRTLTFT